MDFRLAQLDRRDAALDFFQVRLRIANRHRMRRVRDGEAQHRGDVELIAGRHHDHVREEPHVRDVEDAVMRRPVGAGQAGAVEGEDDGQVLQGDFLENLVERALQEGGVDVARWAACPALARPAAKATRVRFADADVEETAREVGAHLFELVPLAHRRRDDGDARILLHQLVDGRR